MSDSKLGYLTPALPDKNLDTEQVTTSQGAVERERVQITGSGASEIARVQSAEVTGPEMGVVVRPINAGFNTLVSGGKVVSTTPGTPVALAGSATPCRHVTVSCLPNNGSYIYVGGSGTKATAGSEEGVLLMPQASYDLDINDVSKIFIDVVNSGDGVTFNYFD